MLPADHDGRAPVTFTRLAELARQANVKLEHGTNAIKHREGQQAAKLTTSYELAGDYRDMRKFIYSLETAPEFIVLENVELAAGDRDSSAR